MSHAKTIKPALVSHPHRHTHDVKHYQVNWEVVKAAARMTLGGILLAVIISLVLQLAYPRSMTLPQTRIGGKSYGLKSEGQIAVSIAAMHGQKMRIESGSQMLSATPKEVGIIFTAKSDAQRAAKYSWRERLVPFSFFFERRELPYYGFTVDESKAKQFAASLQKYNKPPVDALVRLQGAEVVVDRHKEGYIYQADHLVKSLKALKLTSSMKATLLPVVVQPSISDQAAVDVANILQQRLQQPITVQAGGKSIVADSTLLASWMVVVPDVQNKKLHITYDKEKIKQWLTHFASQVYRAGTPRTVTMVDGVVQSDTSPADGLSLNIDATANAIIGAATDKKATVEGVTTPVTVAAQTIRNYTRSSQGLQALFNDWDAANAGTWGVMLKTTDGSIAASFNPHRQFTSASVYKIYVAYVVYTKADNGEVSMTAPTGNGNTVTGCLNIMILRSDNPCAVELGNIIGWDASDGMLRARGFGSTTLTYGGKLTTAQDATEYLLQLESGALLSAGNRAALLDIMSRNIYRYAIPAGSPGIRSANKLGAAGAFNHDVAIVYHPKGTYVLSVFSQGSSHARIRELARQISSVMSQ